MATSLYVNNPLELVSVVELPSYLGRFGATGVFYKGNVVGGIPIGNIGDDFRRTFLLLSLQAEREKRKKKEELGFSSLNWPCWKLNTKGISDRKVYGYWLGDNLRTSDLVRIFQVMSMGHKGPCIMNGLPNVAFIRSGPDQTPVTVYWTCSGGEWCIHTYPGSVEERRGQPRLLRELPQYSLIFGGVADRDDGYQPMAF